jgi:hypothetical protein
MHPAIEAADSAALRMENHDAARFSLGLTSS